MERTVILYHGNCPDGFGGAYAAWKKFQETVEYIPLKHGNTPPETLLNTLDGAHLYFIDFCYPQEVMDMLIEKAASVTVLDHHAGIKEVVENMPEHIFDNDRSGATIAWSYFHPDTPVPAFLKYVEDGDLYRFVLPESRAVLAYMYAEPFTFESWSKLHAELDTPTGFTNALEQGRIYIKYYNLLLMQIVDSAELVSFEGYEVYMVTSSKAFVSDAGNRLYKKQPPFAIMPRVADDGIHVSLRGDGSVDLSAIAQKYGGNGHKGAAGFSIDYGAPIPWTPVMKKDVV